MKVAVEALDNDMELQVEITGALLVKAFDPIKTATVDKARSYRRSLVLVGFDHSVFNQALSNMMKVAAFFQRTVGCSVQIPPFTSTKFGPCIELSCRYLSHVNDVDPEDIMEIEDDVDPNGSLRAVCSSDPHWVYAQENHVTFAKAVYDSAVQRRRYKTAQASDFQTGDIVTCKMSFALAPMRDDGNRHKFLCLLRAVALEDNGPSNVNRSYGETEVSRPGATTQHQQTTEGQHHT
ncbi:hypothetical protein BD626DRAFT_567169 [Schizophyllum amplum]|uniref:Uncharacterized protein n=1 Tax=Schizophyllum amplum TaxID=97359 RepID=A0A550CKD1_9AGAR|nr:hypothetical protein BD626DRAFT_567169 [Auriculariopsis ampla]